MSSDVSVVKSKIQINLSTLLLAVEGLQLQSADGAEHRRSRRGDFTPEILFRWGGHVQRRPLGRHGDPEEHHRTVPRNQTKTEQRWCGGKQKTCKEKRDALSAPMTENSFQLSWIWYLLTPLIPVLMICRTTSRQSATYWRRNIVTNGKRHSWYVIRECVCVSDPEWIWAGEKISLLC